MLPRVLGALVVGGAVVLGPGAAAAQAPFADPVTFRPSESTTLMIDGVGPFRGELQVRRDGDGMTVINALGLDEYVMGVREVPGMWPMEALKAQAVAARTYALWEKRRGHWQQFGYDICGSTACQVYTGAETEAGERGRRWVEAVLATSGEVLLHEGEPALARYHASSGGQTLDNEFVYPSAGPRPYLEGVVDEADEVSPLHRWTVRFTRAELEEILRAAIGLAGTLDDVVSDQNAREVTIRTLGGEHTMATPTFRREVSDIAPRMFPQRFPALREDGERMPMTLPSSRFDVVKTEDGFELRGGGYGHGVGMSQWGAMGRAERGDDYREILAAYYSGLVPTPWSSPDETIRVPVVEDSEAIRILGDGTFDVATEGTDLAASTLGGWSMSLTGERSVQLTPPEGFDLPLVMTGVRAPEELVVDPPETGTSLDVDFVVPKPAEVTAVLSREGEEVARERVIVEAGERRLRIPLDPERLGSRDTYDLEIEAFDGTERVSESRKVVLERPTTSLLVWAGAFAALALGGLLVYRWRRGRL